jgi:hypothetical protein
MCLVRSNDHVRTHCACLATVSLKWMGLVAGMALVDFEIEHSGRVDRLATRLGYGSSLEGLLSPLDDARPLHQFKLRQLFGRKRANSRKNRGPDEHLDGPPDFGNEVPGVAVALGGSSK